MIGNIVGRWGAAALLMVSQVAIAAESPQAPAPPAHSVQECEVWARELSFADSVARHDAAAFAEHLDPGAVFDAADPTPTRGREAIVKAWAGLLDGKDVALWWYPARTTVGRDGASDVAWSSGPYLLVMHARQGAPKRILGTFRSVWTRGADGVWHVIYDAGGEDRRAATEADVDAFHRGRRDRCPAA